MKTIFTKQNSIAKIKLVNPPLNLIDIEVLNELEEHIKKIEEDNEIRIVIIEGEGRAFSAGADIKIFMEIEMEKAYEISIKGQKIMEAIRNSKKTYIAKVHGYALGGGLELALACHITITSKTARLGLPETTLGLIPGWTGTQILPKLIGEKKAIELILTGIQISGEEAERIGLINIAVEEEKLEEKTMEITNKIIGNAPIAIEKAKKLVVEADQVELEEGLRKEAEEFMKLFKTEDLKEGLKAFKEKRKPIYKGK